MVTVILFIIFIVVLSLILVYSFNNTPVINLCTSIDNFDISDPFIKWNIPEKPTKFRDKEGNEISTKNLVTLWDPKNKQWILVSTEKTYLNKCNSGDILMISYGDGINIKSYYDKLVFYYFELKEEITTEEQRNNLIKNISEKFRLGDEERRRVSFWLHGCVIMKG